MCWKYGWLFLLEFPNSSVLIGRSSEWLTQIQSAKTTPLVLCLDLGNTPSFKENTFLFYLLCLYIQKCQRRKKKQKTTLTNKEIHENLNKQTQIPFYCCFWIQCFGLCKVQYSGEDLPGYDGVHSGFCIFQIKREELEAEILSSTEETVLFYNRGI